MTYSELFNIILDRIRTLQVHRVHPLRIGVNGIEGTGKTTFDMRLTSWLVEQDVNALTVPIDGFHFDREHRYRQGRDSAKGYYEDSYDEVAFLEKVLLASQEDPPYIIPATHDLESDEYICADPVQLKRNAVLLTDGAYLFKPIYREHWDLKIYLKTDFETALSRGVQRDAQKLGGEDAARSKFLNRYHKASQIYIDENDPESLADLIIEMTDFDAPEIVHSLS